MRNFKHQAGAVLVARAKCCPTSASLTLRVIWDAKVALSSYCHCKIGSNSDEAC